MKNYPNIKEALNELSEEGYKDEVPSDTFCLYCSDLDLRLNPGFHVDEKVHVGDAGHPGQAAEVYAVSNCAGVKVVVVEEVK